VLKPGGHLALSCWCPVEHMLGYLALEQALAKSIGPEQAVLPPSAWATPTPSGAW
jgi:hypothetical protein